MPIEDLFLALKSKQIAWILALSIIFTGVLPRPLPAQTDDAAPSLQAFAGSWTGLCQDGKPFVILNLQVVSNKIEGTVSIANANYGGSTSSGASCTVQDPASPDHAMKILRAVVDGKRLTIDSRGPQIQIDLTRADAAKLSFPSESNSDAFFEIHKTAGP